MHSIKKQIHRLYTLSALSSFQIAGASWVALLSARGFSLVEIGVAESVFHLTSLLFEIPSGVIADVFGRRRSMILSQCMFVLSALLMAFSASFPLICAALALDALGYNFASGTREALAYDSLKAAGQADRYLDYSSREYAIYRLSRAGAVLCAGLALWLRCRRAYLLDAALGTGCLLVAFRLEEIQLDARQFTGSVGLRVRQCFRESFRFLQSSGPSLLLMLWNALIGAVATLTGFFLQARLSAAGLSQALLGPALFLLSLGGAVGARLAGRSGRLPYKPLSLVCLTAVLAGAACAAGSIIPVMVLGSFLGNLCDDLLEVRTDALLNERFPSSQRATLISVNSLCFSLVMIVLSPLAGLFFS